MTQDVKTFGMEDDATQIAMLRQSTKNILYMVANSSAMSISTDGYLRPVWQIVMICVDIVIVAALALWGMFAVRSVKKKEQQGEKA